MTRANQASPELEESPTYRHKRSIIEEDAARKLAHKIETTWVEIVSDHQNAKGGKVRLCKRTANGNVHRQLIGREKKDKLLIESYSKQGYRVVKV